MSLDFFAELCAISQFAASVGTSKTLGRLRWMAQPLLKNTQKRTLQRRIGGVMSLTILSKMVLFE